MQPLQRLQADTESVEQFMQNLNQDKLPRVCTGYLPGVSEQNLRERLAAVYQQKRIQNDLEFKQKWTFFGLIDVAGSEHMKKCVWLKAGEIHSVDFDLRSDTFYTQIFNQFGNKFAPLTTFENTDAKVQDTKTQATAKQQVTQQELEEKYSDKTEPGKRTEKENAATNQKLAALLYDPSDVDSGVETDMVDEFVVDSSQGNDSDTEIEKRSQSSDTQSNSGTATAVTAPSVSVASEVAAPKRKGRSASASASVSVFTDKYMKLRPSKGWPRGKKVYYQPELVSLRKYFPPAHKLSPRCK